jgi:rubrerythrin
MAKVNADSEILEFAIAREIEANKLFLALAERVDNDAIRKVLQDLAAEELEHKEKLELEIMKLGHVVNEPGKGLIPDHDYVVSDTDAPLDMDYKDILQLGIEKENAAFRIYVDLIGQVKDKASKELLLELAEEEVKHKMRFEYEYDALLKQE